MHESAEVLSVVSIPDVHGDVERLQAALRLANLTDAKHRWRAPAGTVLVQTGDLFDRGDDTKAVYRLMHTIEEQAAAAGSTVYRLLGNHDVMNLMSDLRYVTDGDFASFGGHAARAAAFAQDGQIGSWLLRARICVQVAGTLFVHAGISSRYVSLGGCEQINARASEELARVVPFRSTGKAAQSSWGRSHAAMLEDEVGPVWYRGLAEGSESAACSELRLVLGRFGAERMVVGHTLQHDGMRFRCGGLLVLSDIGMTRGYDDMLGTANRAAVLHAFQRGADGSVLLPHAEYLVPRERRHGQRRDSRRLQRLAMAGDLMTEAWADGEDGNSPF